MRTIVYLLNMCPTKNVDGLTLFVAWHRKKSLVHHLRTLLCIVYI